MEPDHPSIARRPRVLVTIEGMLQKEVDPDLVVVSLWRRKQEMTPILGGNKNYPKRR